MRGRGGRTRPRMAGLVTGWEGVRGGWSRCCEATSRSESTDQTQAIQLLTVGLEPRTGEGEERRGERTEGRGRGRGPSRGLGSKSGHWSCTIESRQRVMTRRRDWEDLVAFS